MDNLTPSQRQKTMRAVKSQGTTPELHVRALCRELGQPGYRLHRADVPGKPDLAYLGRHLAIFVHGCFWHGHGCPGGNKTPKTNAAYWRRKLDRNQTRDQLHQQTLKALGWRVLVLWECEVRAMQPALRKLRRFFQKAA